MTLIEAARAVVAAGRPAMVCLGAAGDPCVDRLGPALRDLEKALEDCEPGSGATVVTEEVWDSLMKDKRS